MSRGNRHLDSPVDIPPPDRSDWKIRDRIRANFDAGSGAYGAFEGREDHFGRLARALVAFGPDLTGARVLDVGCGTGASTRVLERATGPEGRVVGIDISLEMLRQARRAHPGTLLAQADGCGFDRGLRGPFATVCYHAVLFLLPDPAASLDAARGVLGPGGVVLASVLVGADLPDGQSLHQAVADRGMPVGRHAVRPWAETQRALAERFGAVATADWTVTLDPVRFKGFYGLEPMGAGLMPRVPYAERRAVVEAMARDGVSVVQRWRLIRAGGPEVWRETG